ncbi:Helix-turn-helix domain-containing protein [Parafrankia irregularis]|uniref:Helix-turn-helix domain-containing protein n=1 Tax=Parafrankia irregularis TaxID=795642 RepID=A0A0S4R177_9ACTN|nr:MULTISPECIES: helix-turn-helix transcriptional regulator [Parafrankia]MBE3201095.1 helix-turn-helix domain-containing protein [Parafrankia sp. CH37]CUU61199.1 Helix-turn-helix domain-containing protein [Parafrankia irregularis]
MLDGEPIVNRIMLGARLRRLREGTGITREKAGYQIRASDSKISRMELGRVGFKERDVADLLTLYGVVAEADRAPILALARESNRPGWWRGFADVVSPWAEPYLGLEAAAALIRTYHLHLVPDLLQTADYARAVVLQTSSRGSLTDEAVDRAVAMRMARQRLLTRPDPPKLWAVVDEAALRPRIGSTAVLRAQLAHLAELAAAPNIVIQILPAAYGGHVSAAGAFTILRFLEPEVPDVVHLEHLTGAAHLDRPEDVDRYEELMNRIGVDSVTPERTPDHLARLSARLER